MVNLEIQQLLDRLRKEAKKGVCPVCGRLELEALERTLRQYAQANTRLHARVTELERNNLADH